MGPGTSSSAYRVVLAHDWLTGTRGGERVLEQICRLFPSAPLLTLVHLQGAVSPSIEDREIRVSWLNAVPGIARHYRRFLPLMPTAVRWLRVPPCDLLISSSHAVIKGLRPPPGARHLCYLHTPMRYAWAQAESYFGKGRGDRATRLAARLALPALRRWDVATSRTVDRFVYNSRNVAAQALRIYGRDGQVVHPPVDLQRFQPSPAPGPEAPYLMVTAFAPYKAIEVAIQAFRRLDRPLDVIGAGQLFEQLRPHFGGRVRALGALSDVAVAAAYRGCRAFVMPAEEDFGITPLEAQASGRPVIALGKGGALETVLPLGEAHPTGVLYRSTNDPVADLVKAVETFEAHAHAFEPSAARLQAERFSAEVFRVGLMREIDALLRRPVATAIDPSPLPH